MAIALNGLDGNPLSTRDVDGTPNNFVYVAGKLAFSGSYAAGGDTVDFSTIGEKIATGVAQGPLQAVAFSQNGSVNTYVFIQGTALTNWKLKIFVAAGVELAAGAYPASVTSDIVQYQLTVRKLL